MPATPILPSLAFITGVTCRTCVSLPSQPGTLPPRTAEVSSSGMAMVWVRGANRSSRAWISSRLWSSAAASAATIASNPWPLLALRVSKTMTRPWLTRAAAERAACVVPLSLADNPTDITS